MAKKKRINQFKQLLITKRMSIGIIISSLILIFLILEWYIPHDVTNTIMKPEYFVALSTLFGAIVGGLLALLGSVIVNNKNIKLQAKMKRKNEIYKPLYDELRKSHDKNHSLPYPLIIYLNEKDILDKEYPKYIEWWKIKSDSRTFDVPWYIDKPYTELNLIVFEYIEKLKNAKNSIYDKVHMIIGIDKKEEIVKSEVSKEDRIKVIMIEMILKGYKSYCEQECKKVFLDVFLFIYEDKNIQAFKADNERIALAFKAYEACLELPEVIEIRKIYKELSDKEEEILELLGSAIIYINKKHEKNAGGAFYV